MKGSFLIGVMWTFFLCILWGCATTKQYEREYLSNEIMGQSIQGTKQNLRDKFYSTREGAIGCGAGLGGGCGCAK